MKAGNWTPIINKNDPELGEDKFRDWNNQLCFSDPMILQYATGRMQSVRKVFDIGKSPKKI